MSWFEENDGNPKKKWYISDSLIHGKGVFTWKPIKKNHTIGTGVKYSYGLVPTITKDFWSMINHSTNPTCRIRYNDKTGTWDIYANRDLEKHVEVTVDYQNAPAFIQPPLEEYIEVEGYDIPKDKWDNDNDDKHKKDKSKPSKRVVED